MRVPLALAAALCALPGIGLAQAPPRACEDAARTTGDLARCASREAAAAEAHLQGAYRKVLSGLAPADRKLFAKAQDAWVVFRDAQCAFWASGGTAMEAASCKAELSEDRARDFDDWPGANR